MVQMIPLLSKHAVPRAHILSAPTRATLWPGDFVEIDLPHEVTDSDGTFAIGPNFDTLKSDKCREFWPQPQLLSSVSSKIRIAILTPFPNTLN